MGGRISAGRWRDAEVIGRVFRVDYTVGGVCYLLHRLGWSWQAPGWLCFEDEAGQNLRSLQGRTWGRKGHTPIVSFPVQGTGRVSLAWPA
ncbi:winged helix-turn-helix domain-containing protein [Nonomuraea sp. NPDC049714]|uniref:winged helix-turn-helix domain-containing protein n=1 Tax=Nonomuraea sp. NPDC049714 TaxID=3364357 RepID=UPI0037A44BD1